MAREEWGKTARSIAASQEAKAIPIVVLFVGGGLLSAWLAERLVGDVDGASLIALVALPIIAYAIAAGRLSEFKAAGVEAKFVAVAAKRLDAALQAIGVSDDNVLTVWKRNPSELPRIIEQVDESRPIILALKIDGGDYTAKDLITYIETLQRFRSFRFVVVMDRDRGERRWVVVAYADARRVLPVLRDPQDGDNLVRTIRDGPPSAIKRLPGFTAATVATSSTYLEALRIVTQEDLDAVVVIDQRGEFTGLLGREQLLAKLLLGIAS